MGPRPAAVAVASAALAAIGAGCGARVPRPALEPPARGVAVVFAVGAPPARCRVEVERLPAGAFAVGLATIAREEARAGEVRGVDVELEGDRPVLALALALAPAAAPAEDASPERFCAWARDAAARLEREAAAAGEGSAPPPWPTEVDAGRVHFRSVQRVARGGEPAGFAEYAIGARGDGTRVLLSRGAVLVRQRGGWQASDTLHLEDADARGVLVRGRYARIGGGRVQYRLDVRRTGERSYAYAGEAREVPIDGGFETADGLATMLVRIDRFRGRGPDEPVRLEAYEPQADPTRPTAVIHRRDLARPRGIATQIGARVFATGVVDRDGIVEWMESASDPPTRSETIRRSGAP
ncbi:MAG TPA: hypothetical protein VFL83_02215 [Anaeromyxobacter sp.]|nr:hypothetical protein [Anaeromyxobacter sp.]